MRGASFRAVGGAVLTDHGAIGLAEARSLAVFYAREAAAFPEDSPAARLCADRCRALAHAVVEASEWRRAAGWQDPDMAD
ncbi:MAG TPA: hypothetical protein VGH15_00485 [Caulobacteraceae bacterium]|jgi:hypothetical protein